MRAESLLDLKDVGKRAEISRKQRRLQAVTGSKADAEPGSQQARRRWGRLLGLGFVVLLAIGGGYFFLRWITAVFAIEQVQIQGAFHNEQAHQIQVNLSPYVRGDLLTIDLTAARNALQEIAWLKQATLRRQWPNQIVVQIEEYTAVAHWNNGELLSADGQVFTQAYDTDLTALPKLSGPAGREREVLQQYLLLKKLFTQRQLAVTALTLDLRHSWSMRIEGDVLLYLGNVNMENRIERLLSVLAGNAGFDLNSVESIDLRHSNGFAVHWKTGQSVTTGERST